MVRPCFLPRLPMNAREGHNPADTRTLSDRAVQHRKQDKVKKEILCVFSQTRAAIAVNLVKSAVGNRRMEAVTLNKDHDGHTRKGRTSHGKSGKSGPEHSFCLYVGRL